jgi:hypothetical protein
MLAAACSGSSDPAPKDEFQVDYAGEDGIRGQFSFESERLTAEARYPQGSLRDKSGATLATWVMNDDGRPRTTIEGLPPARIQRALTAMSLAVESSSNQPGAVRHLDTLSAFSAEGNGSAGTPADLPQYEPPTYDDDYYMGAYGRRP